MKTFKQFILEQDQVQQRRADIQKKLEAGFDTVNKDLKQMNVRPVPAADVKSKIAPSDKVDLTGSRYDLGGGQSIDPSSISNKPNAKRELGLRKDYRSPPAGYPASVKDRLAAAEAGDEPPTPGSGPYKTTYSDPLKTPPAVPKTTVDKVVPKPKLRPTQEPAVPPPKPKLRPLDNTKQAVSIPEPKSMDLNFTSKGKKQAVEPKAPISKAREQDVITIKDKDKIWNIAGGDPKRVKEILKLNPGLNPNKMPVGYKLKLK